MLRPLTELQTKWARGLCRGPANGTGSVPASLQIRADLGASKSIAAIGLAGLNDAVATASLSLSTTTMGGTGAGSASLENDGLNGDVHGNSLWWISPAAAGYTTARYVQLDVEVFGLPAGLRHVDSRRLLIMAGDLEEAGTRLSAGVDFDWSLVHLDLSSASVTARGGVFTDPQGTYRELRLGVTGMTAAEADGLRQFIAQSRRTTEVCVSIRSDWTAVEASNNVIYGRLVDWSPIQHTGGDSYACENITIHETPYPAL